MQLYVFMAFGEVVGLKFDENNTMPQQNCPSISWMWLYMPMANYIMDDHTKPQEIDSPVLVLELNYTVSHLIPRLECATEYRCKQKTVPCNIVINTCGYNFDDIRENIWFNKSISALHIADVV